MRELVSPEQLLAILNRELDRHRDCRGARFSSPHLVARAPDAGGCNWQREDVYLSTSGSVSSKCWSHARRILKDASERYNLVVEDRSARPLPAEEA